jgi:O-antigen ligase
VILFGSLVAFHDTRAVLVGTLAGFIVGAVAYTRTQGFPFTYPADFSYNAIAGMYLFGLFCALTCVWGTRSKIVPAGIALIFLMHVAATTSIKFNLGIALGAAVAAVLYFRSFTRLLWRHGLLIIVAAGDLVYAVLSNAALLESVQGGFARIGIGLQVLQAREDVAGYSGFNERQQWLAEGLQGWKQNPLFGHGVEAFRHQFDITSHSTPVDLLYNSGLIGLVLFYAVFASLAARISQTRTLELGPARTLIVATLVCYLFVSLSAILHTSAFFAAFIGIATAILTRHRQDPGVNASLAHREH